LRDTTSTGIVRTLAHGVKQLTDAAELEEEPLLKAA